MSAPNLTKPALALPRTEWRATLRDTTIDVFSMMVGVAISDPGKDAPSSLLASVTGVVGIAGPLRATFTLQCSSGSSVKFASQMLGMSPDDPKAQSAACDALGEICNIVAGDFKARIGFGDACKLSLPTIIVGRAYKFHHRGLYDRLEFPLVCDGETLEIALEIAK